jgi:hypothetical protein
VSVRPGLLPQDTPLDYHFTAKFSDIHGVDATGSPAQFTVTANPPAAGTIFTFVNTYHAYGSPPDPLPGPATISHLNYPPRGIATATDGTVYFATDCAIKKVSKEGVMSQVAGTDQCGSSLAEGGPAVSAQVYNVRGLALDQTNGILYYADYSNNLVRYVNLNDKTVHTFAGGGASSMPAPYGDGGDPRAAYLPSPSEISISGDNLYVTDAGHGSIRVVSGLSLGGTTINMWMAPQGGTTTCANTPTILYGCGSNDQSCSIVWDGTTSYVSGYFCGTSASYYYGVVRRDSGGTLTRLAGNSVANSADGILPTTASFGTIPKITLDANKILYLSVQGEHRIRKFDTTAVTPSITTIAGTNGSAGYAGDYVAATGALLYNPSGIALKNGHLLISDVNNYVVREIW